MEFRHVKYFIAVAETLNFGRAAERLHISQPPLSHQIHQLEDDLGVKLFDRAKRQIELTSAGEIFLAQARQVLAQIEYARHLSRRASCGEIGQLRIGLTTYTLSSLVVPCLMEFLKAHSAIHASIRTLPAPELVDDLRNHRLDVGFATHPGRIPGLKIDSVLPQKYVLALPRHHDLAHYKHISFEELSTEPHIMFPRYLHPELYDYLIGICRKAGYSPNIAHEQTDIFTTLALVGAGQGVAFFTERARQFFHSKSIVFRDLRPSPSVDLAMIYRSDDRSPVISQFLNIVKRSRKLTSFRFRKKAPRPKRSQT